MDALAAMPFTPTHVVVFGGTAWPACRTPLGVLVDLRLFDTTVVPPVLAWCPDQLPPSIPAALRAQAAVSMPPGFALVAATVPR